MIARVLAAAVAAVALAACGGAAPTVTAPAAPVKLDPYVQKCQTWASEYEAKVSDHRYVPVDLLVHEWPSDATPTTGNAVKSFLPEAKFVDYLVSPAGKRVRTTLVLARGGTGKSALANSLRAQACGRAMVLHIDLNTDIAMQLDQKPAGQNAVSVAAARQMNLSTTAGADAAVKAAFGDGKTLVVILDSLDEVPLMQRQAVVGAVDEFVQMVAPAARALVLARPPVFTSNYGLTTVDARLELPGLQCGEAEAALPETEKANFREFTGRYGLARKVVAFDRCYYPHMSTRRDLEVLRMLASNSAIDKSPLDFRGFQASRAQVYVYFVKAQLLKDMQGLLAQMDDGLSLVDRMVAAKNPVNGQRNLDFSLQDCVAAATTDNKQAVCERLLQSSLFKQADGHYHFDNQSIGDLFLARWTVTQLEASGKPDCTVIDKLSGLLESSEVAGFLVGQPAGQACFARIAAELTKRSGCSSAVFELLDQGLPGEPERKRILDAADADLARMPPSFCLTTLVENLKAGAPGVVKQVDPTPVDAKAAAPVKAKKKGK